MMEIVTRAIFDCLDEEIILLNEDIEEDVIISSIKNLISEEGVEFREDTVENCGMASTGRGSSEHLHKTSGYNHPSRGHGSTAIIESKLEQIHNDDDERTNLLATKGDRIYQDVPDLIAFTPKKRRHDPHGEETQSQDRTFTSELNSSFFFVNNMSSNRRMEEVATNKNHLKLSRWMRRGKRGLLTIKKSRPSDRQLKNSQAEF